MRSYGILFLCIFVGAIAEVFAFSSDLIALVAIRQRVLCDFLLLMLKGNCWFCVG